jgi:hypothetical protein
MSEFILVAPYSGYDDAHVQVQLLVNTDEIVKVEQRIENGVPTTHLTRKGGYVPIRINESVAQVATLLAAPIGRFYPMSFGGGGGGNFQPVSFKQY